METTSSDIILLSPISGHVTQRSLNLFVSLENLVFSLLFLGLTSCDLSAESGPSPIVIDKVLLEHGHVHRFSVAHFMPH